MEVQKKVTRMTPDKLMDIEADEEEEVEEQMDNKKRMRRAIGLIMVVKKQKKLEQNTEKKMENIKKGVTEKYKKDID